MSGEAVVKEREYFSSRLAFICAAVGSAVGFGNVWRFPALAAEYGGGAFFVPYILALFIIGIPVIFLEISLGQLYQTGDFGVFYSFHRRLGGVGVSSIACGYIVITYYGMLIAWVINAFFDSFNESAPWTDPEITGADAKGYFYNTIIGMSTINADLTATRIVPANVGYSALGWFVVWLCTAWGKLCYYRNYKGISWLKLVSHNILSISLHDTFFFSYYDMYCYS